MSYSLPRVQRLPDALPGLETWLAEVDQASPAQLTAWHAWLDPQEQSRAAAFVFERDRGRFVARHAALRFLLSQRLGLPPQALQFAFNPFGKPSLAGLPGAPHFNLSHSAGLALIVLHPQHPVGVDIEFCRADLDLEQIARRFFSPTELSRFLTLAPEQRLPAFYTLWTRKEAYLKALGLGVSLEPQSFDVNQLPPSIHLQKVPVEAGYQAAVCMQLV